MDCHKLRSDIERLKSLRDELSSKLEASTESGLGKIALSTVSNEATSCSEALIEEYIEDIVQQNINDPAKRNDEFISSLTPESRLEIINQDTTIDEVRNNLGKYLLDDLSLSSNLLVYALKEKIGDKKDNNIKEALKSLFFELGIEDKLPISADKLYLPVVAERLKNLEVLETKNYIFMLPKDKWEQGKIKLPNPENNSDTPEFIAPNDLTAVLKQPVNYDWNYETDGRITDSPALVYDEKWVGREIKHFPWSKELSEAEAALLKPNGFHIPAKENWVQIYNNLKAKYGDKDEDISLALREDLNLAFSGFVWVGDLKVVGSVGYFWSASEGSADYAHCLDFDSDSVGPESWNLRDYAQSVRCVSGSGSFPNS